MSIDIIFCKRNDEALEKEQVEKLKELRRTGLLLYNQDEMSLPVLLKPGKHRA